MSQRAGLLAGTCAAACCWLEGCNALPLLLSGQWAAISGGWGWGWGRLRWRCMHPGARWGRRVQRQRRCRYIAVALTSGILKEALQQPKCLGAACLWSLASAGLTTWALHAVVLWASRWVPLLIVGCGDFWRGIVPALFSETVWGAGGGERSCSVLESLYHKLLGGWALQGGCACIPTLYPEAVVRRLSQGVCTFCPVVCVQCPVSLLATHCCTHATAAGASSIACLRWCGVLRPQVVSSALLAS
jgi:hypothetical protein